jgi:hypothetical protein
MNEAEWLACTDPMAMLEFVLGRSGRRNLKISQRQNLLFVVAYCYRVWDQMDEPSRRAVLVLERLADGLATEIEFLAAHEKATRNVYDIPTIAVWLASKTESADFLREIYNSHRRLVLDPAVLTWNGSTVVRLAQAAYDERNLPEGTLDNARLAVLADALEEAGCPDVQIVGHLRSGGDHVRGCWVLDLLLGKS